MWDNMSNPKLIPTLAKKRNGKDNYRKWRFEAEVALRYCRTFNIVRRTATIQEAHGPWEDKTNWTVSLILNNIDEEVKDVIPQDGNQAILWTALKE
ncbi:hypothetical protein Q9L58_010361 [Maublancomyces gigas]|uniref:Uncharacterized protein n=1 Tax=Discina gigas TaxID=1032678 RepID=A0ABR3G4B0_9PEZI